MENIKVRDVKKALRLSGWRIIREAENPSGFSIYTSPDNCGYLTICGKGNEEVSSNVLSIVERRLGQCFGSVLT